MTSESTVVLAVLGATVASGVVVALVTWFVTRRAISGRGVDRNVLEIGDVLEVGEKLIDVLATAGLVLSNSNAVVRYSASATAMGLINNRSLAVPELLAIVNEVRRSGEPVFQELELARKSGDYYWVDVRAALAGNGNVVLLLEDNTEGHRLDDARRDFIANISHELKTPIGAIGLLAEALVGATDDPETVRKFSKNLLKESRRLADLVQDIIQLSRVQSNEVLRKATPVRISDIIAEATERCAILAESQSISITVECPESEYVVGDSELLIVAVKNLIDNAIQYSEPKKRVGIGVKATDNSVQIAVADAGMGIPQDEQARIFERFYRVDASRSRQTGGTGLGLSLVKHIALSHGGEVTLFSQVGIGSTFTIRLPRFDPAQLEALS
jgi:two-component system sensor histidine kinase SenX3